MTLIDDIREKLQKLPTEQQLRVLEFVNGLAHAESRPRQLRNLEGIWEGKVHITDEDIAEARREMWGKFDRDDAW